MNRGYIVYAGNPPCYIALGFLGPVHKNRKQVCLSGGLLSVLKENKLLIASNYICQDFMVSL